VAALAVGTGDVGERLGIRRLRRSARALDHWPLGVWDLRSGGELRRAPLPLPERRELWRSMHLVSWRWSSRWSPGERKNTITCGCALPTAARRTSMGLRGRREPYVLALPAAVRVYELSSG